MQQMRQFDKSTPNYWVARLIGFTPNSFQREFARPIIDRSEANSVESRYVYYYWHLDDGLYEGVFCRNFDRQFFTVESGKIDYITKDQAQTWLNNYLENQCSKRQESE